jgi:hypothetical protein
MNAPARPEVPLLKPEQTKIFQGTFDMLHVQIGGDIYRGVFAVAAFPVSSPRKYISLFYYDEDDKLQEIGMIEDIIQFPEETSRLILDTLKKHYFSYMIEQINHIKFEYGLVFFDVETDKGHKEFAMRWEASRAVDLGASGKILLDVFDDRYVVQDVGKLTRIERDLFTRYIYW